MTKTARQIAALAVALLLICAMYRMTAGHGYAAYYAMDATAGAPERWRFNEETPGVVSYENLRARGQAVRVEIRPQSPGETRVQIQSAEGETLSTRQFRVGRFMTVYDTATGGFSGDHVVLIAVTCFWLAVSFLMLRAYWRSRWPAFYSYSTIYAAGFSMFALLTGSLMLFVTVRHISDPLNYPMRTAYAAMSTASYTFMRVTAPLVLVFAVAMAVSNVELLRHEGFSMRNALGILAGALMVSGEVVAAVLYARDFSGSETTRRVLQTLKNAYATAFVYFECMLIGAIVCGLRAARHVPSQDRDFLIILGCRFRKDGTLTPLLQGRVDRAIQFWNAQREATGREAVFIPSGGQGADESMPEAEAMRRYLLQKGIPEEYIIEENRSRNTYQNMQYSKAIIESRDSNARVAYFTTNYHVFRSGVWASLAGLPCEGAGSNTKWWYWPNAFMRECAGLLLNRLKLEIMLLAVLLAFLGMLTALL